MAAATGDFSVRHGDTVVITGYDDDLGNYAIDATDSARSGDSVTLRLLDKEQTSLSAHLLRVATCQDDSGGLVKTGERLILQNVAGGGYSVHPDGSDVEWVSQEDRDCRQDLERFQFVPRDNTYSLGGPLCPQRETEVQVYRENQSKDWILQKPEGAGTLHKWLPWNWGEDKTQYDLHLDTDPNPTWRVWKTEGFVCRNNKCEPWKMDAVPTTDRTPYSCETRVDKAGNQYNWCVTNDQSPLFSLKEDCEKYCKSGDNKGNGGNNKGNGGGGSPNNPPQPPQPPNPSNAERKKKEEEARKKKEQEGYIIAASIIVLLFIVLVVLYRAYRRIRA